MLFRDGVRSSSRVVGIASAASVAAIALPAAAAPTSNDTELSVDARASYLRAMPRFDLDTPTVTTGRTVGTGTLPSIGAQPFVALSGDTAYVRDQRWVVPIFGVSVGGAVGPSPRVFSSVDGTVVAMKPWTSFAAWFLLPGIGVRAKARRWMFQATVRPVVSLVAMSVDFGSGDADGSTIVAASLGARAHAEVCRRLDPETRACAFVEPNLYEFSEWNGGSLGLRWEWGR